MIRMIYLPVTDAGDLADCLDEALPLARAFRSHLCVDFIRPDPRGSIPFVGEGLTADVIQDLVEAAEREGRARADRALAMFRERLAAAGVAVEQDTPIRDAASARFHESVGLITERVGRMARVHDLSVLPRPGADHRPEAGELFDEALFRSGRPVLLAPPRGADARETAADRPGYRHVVMTSIPSVPAPRGCSAIWPGTRSRPASSGSRRPTRWRRPCWATPARREPTSWCWAPIPTAAGVR